MLCSPWLDEQDLAGCDCDFDTAGPQKVALMIDAASEILFSLSGSRFSGVCSSAWRPPCHGTYYSSLPRPVADNGVWYNRGCGCGQPLLLPVDYPLSVAVTIDGAAFLAHRLEGRVLWRTDGSPWPCCQNLALPASEPDTFALTISHGLLPPAAGILAARALAVQLVRACAGQDCALPFQVTSMVRQGVSLNLGEWGASLSQEDLVGITEVDLFLKATNPNRLRQRASFWSPDVPATLR